MLAPINDQNSNKRAYKKKRRHRGASPSVELWNTVWVPAFSLVSWGRIEGEGRCMGKKVSDSQAMRMLFSGRKRNGVSIVMSRVT